MTAGPEAQEDREAQGEAASRDVVLVVVAGVDLEATVPGRAPRCQPLEVPRPAISGGCVTVPVG